MNRKPIEQAKDPDLRASPAAMRRAAQRAREVAACTGTRLVREQNGKVVWVEPDREEDTTA